MALSDSVSKAKSPAGFKKWTGHLSDNNIVRTVLTRNISFPTIRGSKKTLFLMDVSPSVSDSTHCSSSACNISPQPSFSWLPYKTKPRTSRLQVTNQVIAHLPPSEGTNLALPP